MTCFVYTGGIQRSYMLDTFVFGNDKWSQISDYQYMNNFFGQLAIYYPLLLSNKYVFNIYDYTNKKRFGQLPMLDLLSLSNIKICKRY